MKMFTTMMDEDLSSKLKELADKQGKKILKLVEEAVVDLLKKYGVLK